MDNSVAEVASFVNGNIRMDIMFSRVEYELTCQFVDKENKMFSLQDVLTYEAIDEFKGFYQVANKANIEKGIAYLSKVQMKKLEYITKHMYSDMLNEEL